MSSLFRAEAVEHRRQRLEGDIVLTRSVSLWVMTTLLAAVAVTLVLWVTLGQYRRTETVPGEVLPTGNFSKVFADRPGRILWVGVQEGQQVQQGQAIATIQIEQALAGGLSPNAERLASFSSQARLIRAQRSYENDRAAGERSRLVELIAGLNKECSTMSDQLALQRQTVESA